MNTVLYYILNCATKKGKIAHILPKLKPITGKIQRFLSTFNQSTGFREIKMKRGFRIKRWTNFFRQFGDKITFQRSYWFPTSSMAVPLTLFSFFTWQQWRFRIIHTTNFHSLTNHKKYLKLIKTHTQNRKQFIEHLQCTQNPKQKPKKKNHFLDTLLEISWAQMQDFYNTLNLCFS